MSVPARLDPGTGSNANAGEDARAPQKPRKRSKKKKESLRPKDVAAGGMWFAPPAAGTAQAQELAANLDADAKKQAREHEKEQKKKERKEHRRDACATRKNDPEFVAAAREFRDRWLERAAQEPGILERSGKYDVSRSLARDAGMNMDPVRRMVGGDGPRVVLPVLPAQLMDAA